MRRNPKAADVRNEWGNMTLVMRPIYTPVKAGALGITKAQMMQSVKSVSDGLPVGIYRDDERKVPVLLKSDNTSVTDAHSLENLSVWNGKHSAPLSQVTQGVETAWEWPQIRTYNRQLSMAAMCGVQPGHTMAEVHGEIRKEIEAMELPEGYTFFWDSQYKDQNEGLQALAKFFPLAFLMLIVILVALFGNFREPGIILCILPLSLIGVAASLALPALHAQIAKNNSVKWEIVSATINENVGMIVDEIYRHQPDIIAATTWLFNHEQLLHITARLKALLPNSCFILGGPEFLGNNEDFLHKNPFIDCVFRGEGEEAFPQWLSCWNQPEKWDSIPGLCYMNPQKQYIDNGIARVLNFSRLVPPENSSFFNWSKPFVQLETTRGCFNTCAFCVSGEEKPVRTLSIESIRERLQIIHSHGIKNVRVLDRTFNYNPRRAKELLQLFLEFNPDICFHLEIHPALLSEELKNELKKLPKGLLHLEAGIQSLREPVLQKSRRMGSLEDSLQGLRFLCSLPNMETHADLIASNTSGLCASR